MAKGHLHIHLVESRIIGTAQVAIEQVALYSWRTVSYTQQTYRIDSLRLLVQVVVVLCGIIHPISRSRRCFCHCIQMPANDGIHLVRYSLPV